MIFANFKAFNLMGGAFNHMAKKEPPHSFLALPVFIQRITSYLYEISAQFKYKNY